jgi:hypothetical protein
MTFLGFSLHGHFRFSIVHCSVAPQIQASMGSEEIEVDLYRMHAGCLKLEWIYTGMLEIWSSIGFRIVL